MESSHILPEDLIIEILSRLPVKSIIRFKCVCKTWCSLPRNPRLISRHYRNSNKPGVLDWNDEDVCNQLGSKTMRDFHNGILDFLPLDGQLHFLLGGLEKKKPDAIVGLCDGVFCLLWDPVLRDHVTGNPATIALWNPATRDFRILPMSNCEFPPYKRVASCSVGFGRDPQTGDYKVVKRNTLEIVEYTNMASTRGHLVSGYGSDDEYGAVDEYGHPVGYPGQYGVHREVSEASCAEVYTLSTDSWRLLNASVDEDSAFQSVLSEADSIHIDGVLYWGSYEKDGDKEYEPRAVLSFDMRDEVFRVTSFPNKYNTYRKRLPSHDFKFSMLSVLHGQLSLSCWFFDRRVMRVVSLDVWVMEDHGDEDSSWSHVFSITPPFHGFTSAICFWKTGELVCVRDGERLSDSGYPVLYDLVTGKTRELQLFGEENFIYKESLVSLKSETAPADDETVLVIQERT